MDEQIEITVTVADADDLDFDEPIKIKVPEHIKVQELKRIILRETKNRPFLLPFVVRNEDRSTDLLKRYQTNDNSMWIFLDFSAFDLTV